VIIDFQCNSYEITRSSSTEKVTGYCFEKSSKSIAFLDKTQIIAITGEKISTQT
jgi:glutathione peroxidase-family protein